MPTPADPPVRVRLTGLSGLVPAELDGAAACRAWLTAPIAGESLYRRALSVLIDLPVLELVLEPGPTSDAVLALFEERPVYNLKARMALHARAASPQDADTLVVPGGGLLEADLTGVLRRGRRGQRIERTPVTVSGAEGGGAEILYLPPGSSAEEYDPATPPGDVYRPAPPVLHPTSRSVALRELAQRALEGDLSPFPPRGEWRDELLVGKGARVDPTTRVIGKAAVGGGSQVGPRVVLGHGAVVGEGCRVAARALLTHAMVLDGGEVAEDEHLLGLVRLPDGSSI